MLLIQLAKARQKIAMIVFQRLPKIFQLLTKDCQISSSKNPAASQECCHHKVCRERISRLEDLTNLRQYKALEWTNKTHP
jgi:hypothetical protein